MSEPKINVTPLIDVLLVLLIIFMVITPPQPSALDAKIPQEPTDDPLVIPRPDTLVVAIDRDSSLRLNRENLAATVDDTNELVQRLRAVFDQRTLNLAFAETRDGTSPPRIEKTVFIKAPQSLDYGSVAKVLDAVKMSGASPVSLQIDDLD